MIIYLYYKIINKCSLTFLTFIGMKLFYAMVDFSCQLDWLRDI